MVNGVDIPHAQRYEVDKDKKGYREYSVKGVSIIKKYENASLAKRKFKLEEIKRAVL